MTLTNATLINLVKQLGETKAADLLASKLKHDAQQAAYHKKYNATRAAVTREVNATLKREGITLGQLLQRARNEGKTKTNAA